MTKIILTIVAAVALSAAVATAVIHGAGPSTVELDSEIAATEKEIASADAEAARYSDGLISVQTRLRAAILKNTAAMLKQKRESFLRGITLNYQDPLPRITALSDRTSTALWRKSSRFNDLRTNAVVLAPRQQCRGRVRRPAAE